MTVIILLLVGILLGMFLLVGVIVRDWLVGVLRIDDSDPDGPFLFLELTKNFDVIRKNKYVLMKVEDGGFPSRK